MNMDGRREATTFGRGWEKGTETHGFSTESEWTRTQVYAAGNDSVDY